MAPCKSWEYSIPSEDGKFVTCNICDSILSFNGSTSAIIKHLRGKLSVTPDIALTNDGWFSRSQDSYISTTAHFINENWVLKNYTLCTQFMEDRHSGENLASYST